MRATTVHTLVDYCTYVVRKSDRKDYETLGVPILSIDDDKINSFVKVNNWLIENAEEDVIAVLDDDISNFYYCIESAVPIDRSTVTAELERLCQVLYDLNIGLLGSRISSVPWGYKSEFRFAAMIGPIRIYNRAFLKSRYIQMEFFTDTDFALQEILLNRIILRPDYLTTDAKIETNKGGMNLKRNRMSQIACAAAMKQKWGSSFKYLEKRNITKILVTR